MNIYENKLYRQPPNKKFYRVSKERLEAYKSTLSKINDILKGLKPESNTGKVEWEPVDAIWGATIDLLNSISGFQMYVDEKEEFDDGFLYNSTHLDNVKFYEIEFGSKDKK